MSLILLIILIILLFGSIPYRDGYGYGWGPPGVLGVLVVVLIVLLLTGRI